MIRYQILNIYIPCITREIDFLLIFSTSSYNYSSVPSISLHFPFWIYLSIHYISKLTKYSKILLYKYRLHPLFPYIILTLYILISIGPTTLSIFLSLSYYFIYIFVMSMPNPFVYNWEGRRDGGRE